MPTKGREIFKVIHKNGDFVLYHLRKNIFRKTLYFSRSRDLPLEGESFFIQAAHFEFPRRLLFEGIKLFRETPTKTASLSGNK